MQEMVSPFRISPVAIWDPLSSDGKKEKGIQDIRLFTKAKLFNAPTSTMG